jgi:hypothetical protein
MSDPRALLIKEVRPVERIPLHWFEAGVADDAAKLFFRGAIGYTGGADYVFFEHHGADVVAAEAQAELADFQSLGDPARLHIQKIREEQARDGQIFQIFDGGGFVPFAAAERGILRLECPRDERGEAAGFFLQIVDRLQMINAVFVLFADPEHHGRSGSHAELVRGAMDVDPVFGQAFQARNAMADLVVENFGAAAGDGIEAGITQAGDSVANGEAAVLGDGNYF